MQQVYFAVSYSHRKEFEEEISVLVQKAERLGFAICVFVDRYHFKETEEKKMMQTAFQKIDNSDFLIADLTHQSIGVGIELGYAHAQQIPVLYIRKKGSKLSTTAAGSADFIMTYKNADDMTRGVLAYLTHTSR